MNLFRIYSELRKDESFRVRHQLLRKLEGKSAFTEEDLNEVFAYRKMPYHSNSEAEKYTEKAFASQDLGEKFRLLKRLNGIGIVVASTVLMFQNPRKYAELNHRTWSQLKRNYGFTGSDKDHRSDFAVGEYNSYLEALAPLADEYGMNLSDIEFVLSAVD